MARKFLTAIDLGTNELQNAVIQNLAAASEPTGVKGRIYFDSTNNIIKFYDGSVWKGLATGGDLSAYATLTGEETLSNKTISDALTFYDGTGSQSTIYASGSDLSVYAHNDLYLNTNNGNINLQPDGVAQIWGSEIATQSWVTGQSYATTSSLDGYLPNSGNNTYTGRIDFYPSDNSGPMAGYAGIEYKGDTDANGAEGLYITSSRGWINDPPSHPQTGGKTFITSYDTVDINAQHGNIQLWTPNGGIYVNDELVASQDWVGQQGYLTSASLSGYVTETGVEVLTNKTFNDYLYFTNPSTNPNDGSIGVNDSNEHFEITAITASLILESVNSDIVFSGATGVYLNDPTFSDNQVATIGDFTNGSNNISGSQFTAALINLGTGNYGGYTFIGDGGLDTGMFSDGDGSIRFYSNAQEVMNFTSPSSGVTILQDLTVNGDLNVDGVINAVNRTEVNIEDNTIKLNTSFTGTPISNAGITVERGDYTDASLYWNETANKWYVGTPADNTDAVVATAISLAGHGHTASDISDFNTAIDSHLSGSNSISYSSGIIDTTLKTSNSYLSKSSGLAVDVSALETKLTTDGYVKKYAENNSAITISGGVASWTVTHGLSTRDVTVQVYTVAGYEAVEVDVVRTSTSALTLTWNASANVDADTYRVVVTG